MTARRAWLALLPAALALAALACEPFRARSEGEKLWSKRCGHCHGADAAGNTPRYMGNSWADLTDDVWKHGGDEHSIRNVVREGVFGEMPGNEELTDEQVDAIVEWLFRLRGETR
jgi:mono/diheme cytochrome c family protein